MLKEIIALKFQLGLIDLIATIGFLFIGILCFFVYRTTRDIVSSIKTKNKRKKEMDHE